MWPCCQLTTRLFEALCLNTSRNAWNSRFKQAFRSSTVKTCVLLRTERTERKLFAHISTKILTYQRYEFLTFIGWLAQLLWTHCFSNTSFRVSWRCIFAHKAVWAPVRESVTTTVNVLTSLEASVIVIYVGRGWHGRRKRGDGDACRI